MGSTRKAVGILAILVCTSLGIFCLERKFLVPHKRGTEVANYSKLPWLDKILLLIDDFEGIQSNAELQQEKFFAYGSAHIGLDASVIDNNPLASKTALKVTWNGPDTYGGWGKGIGENLDLDATKNYLNLRVYVPERNKEDEILKVVLEEDDNDDGKLEKDKDDAWFYTLTITPQEKWQFISIPLKDFTDENEGGDHVLNVTRKGGLHTVVFALMRPEKYTSQHAWYFDFIFLSSEKIEEPQNTNTLN